MSLVPRSEPVEWLEGIRGKDTYAYGYDVQAGEFGNFVSKEHGARGGYRFNGWRLERRRRRLVDPNEKSIPLSKREYALLLAFLETPGRPLARERLLRATRVHEDIFDRSIDVQILRLRRKLETDTNAPRMIQTERGFGYVFALPVERY